jgi:hypothetical protein
MKKLIHIPVGHGRYITLSFVSANGEIWSSNLSSETLKDVEKLLTKLEERVEGGEQKEAQPEKPNQAHQSQIDQSIFAARRETSNSRINSAKRYISVQFQREGIHQYVRAADDPTLADVAFLAYPHRHVFHFKVTIEVFHNDRDIEFIQFKRWCESLYSNDDPLELNHRSCEMIADELFAKIAEKYLSREVSIEVSEDNENGCVILYPVSTN